MVKVFPKRLFLNWLYFLLGILLVWYLYLLILPTKNTVLNYLYNLGYSLAFFTSAGISIYGIKILGFGAKVSKSLLFFGLAAFLYATGLVIWVYFNLVLKVAIPYPSVADIFFVAFYPVLGLGILTVLGTFVTISNKKVIFETMFLAIVAVFLINILNRPDLSANLSVLTKVLNVAYPLFDVLLISLTYVSIRISSRKIEPSLMLIICALIFQAAGNLLFSYRSATNIYWNGDIADFFLTMAGISIAFAVINIIDRVHRNANY